MEAKIGIWGTSFAGKTTFISMLYHAFEANSNQWEIFAEDDERRVLETIFNDLFYKHTFPKKTNHANRFRYVVKRRDLPQPIQVEERIAADINADNIPMGTEITLELLDVPGELYVRYYDRNRREESKRETPIGDDDTYHYDDKRPLTPNVLFEHLRSCQGILIFIDPNWEHEAKEPRIPQLLYQLLADLKSEQRNAERNGETLTIPWIALCVMKVDGSKSLWRKRDVLPQRCYRTGQNDHTYCETSCPVYQELGSTFMLRQLPNLQPLERIRCYGVSAIGRVADDTPNVGEGFSWARPLTTEPPMLKHVAQDFDFLKELTINPPQSYNENLFLVHSINNPNQIQPHNLISPVLWIIRQLLANDAQMGLSSDTASGTPSGDDPFAAFVDDAPAIPQSQSPPPVANSLLDDVPVVDSRSNQPPTGDMFASSDFADMPANPLEPTVYNESPSLYDDAPVYGEPDRYDGEPAVYDDAPVTDAASDRSNNPPAASNRVVDDIDDEDDEDDDWLRRDS